MLDNRIRTAIVTAAAEAGQPLLADKLIAWLDALATGNTNLEDREATRRHLQLLYESVSVPSDADNGSGS